MVEERYFTFVFAQLMIIFSGTAARKAWKKDKPGQYMFWKHHGLFSHKLMLHHIYGSEYLYVPDDADGMGDDWIVSYK